MKNKRLLMNGMRYIFLMIIIFITRNVMSQPVVGLDNWYNNEISESTGNPYHYLWEDTEWSGYSRWGEIFREKGAEIKTVGKPRADVLNQIDIYIIVDPDTVTESSSPEYVRPEDITSIKEWVWHGGVLLLMANDGPNCEYTHFNQLASVFGITFNHVTLHPVTGNNYEMGACIDLPDHSLFDGVSKIFMKEIADINVSGEAEPVLIEEGQVLMAECICGDGYVFAIGDPWIYNEYIDHDRLPDSFENRKAAENLSDLLLSYALKNQ